MIANRRGSNRLAGAASLKSRKPAIVWTFGIHPETDQVVEQRTDSPRVAGVSPVFPMLCEQLSLSDPDLTPAILAK